MGVLECNSSATCGTMAADVTCGLYDRLEEGLNRAHSACYFPFREHINLKTISSIMFLFSSQKTYLPVAILSVMYHRFSTADP